jgi:DNA mismatch repair protein MutS
MSKKTKITLKQIKPDNEDSIYGEYFQCAKEYQEKYGERTIVLMLVGAFFEVYALKNPETSEITGSKIEDFSQICQMVIADKKMNYCGGNLVFAGFRDFTLEKHLEKLTDAGYTVPVFIQQDDENSKKKKRILHNVYSAGTYMSCEQDSNEKITNNIMCIWFEKYKGLFNGNGSRENLVYGVSVVNMFTGKSNMFQYETQFFMNISTFDELERYVCVYNPSEVLIISPFDSSDISKIIQMSGISSQNIHYFSTLESKNEKIVRCMNQKYIKEIIGKSFGVEAFDICSEFQENIIATQSFCFLLNFMQEHNADLIRKVSIPDFNNTSTRMTLANHTHLQLNIISDNASKNGKLSCVSSFLNKCCSSMGKRLFKHQILNPNFDDEWLNKEYEMTGFMLDNYHFVDLFRKQLSKLKDIEKMCRQVVIKKIYPSAISQLYSGIEIAQQINTCLFENKEVCEYLCDSFEKIGEQAPNIYIEETCGKIKKFLNDRLIIDMCSSIQSMTNFEENIICKGYCRELDDIEEEYNKTQVIFFRIKQHFNDLIQNHENNHDTEYIKIHETEKSGVSLQITAKRSQLLRTVLNKMAGRVKMPADKSFSYDEVKFTKASSTNMEIEFPLLNSVCKDLLLLKDKMNKMISIVYLQTLDDLEKNCYSMIENICTYLSKVDVLQNKTYVAKQYNYCKPQIDTSATKSFLDARELRHCLIEHIQENEIYVTNDVKLGTVSGVDGMLVYGTNAVGKTSLIRAVGIAIIMAQSGMYVPCSKFLYKPYQSIFSRILGNDNLFKGLSTFAVEMTELRIILKNADENSMILGDELCSGTETESALSIFIAGLIDFCKKTSSFIFATHFHEIVDYDEITQLKNKMALMHMSVHYDREMGCLIYDRKLKAGSGPKTYGLEVCKSLFLSNEFMESAYSIRNKYFPETNGILSHKTTVYNSSKIRGLCEICEKKLGEEIHHLNPQKNADQNGHIGNFHKNHKANLISICEECHDKIHKENYTETLVKKKTTAGYKLMKDSI